jgi:hypothetical protein
MRRLSKLVGLVTLWIISVLITLVPTLFAKTMYKCEPGSIGGNCPGTCTGPTGYSGLACTCSVGTRLLKACVSTSSGTCNQTSTCIGTCPANGHLGCYCGVPNNC